MLVQNLTDAMELIAPLKYAESWDKVGLALGVPSRSITGPVLLTIDLSERVLNEALDQQAGAIIAYHPPIWNPLEVLTNQTHTQRIIRGAAEAKIAIYSPHTALDSTKDGVTDWLCEGISSNPGESKQGSIQGDCRALTPSIGGDHDREVKVITFVPTKDVDKLRNAMGTAGAGGIGKYRLCSFNTQGEGTFLPQEGTNPVVGEIGSLERVAETRIEMVCSKRALPLVIETLKEFHPYETPAYDIVELMPEPLRSIGGGRRLVLDQAATISQLADRLKSHLDRSRIRYALAVDEDHKFRTVGVVPGSGGSMAQLAKQEGCELLITGEMTHHEILAASQSGLSVLLAGHTNTERGYLPRLKEKLEKLLPDAQFILSQSDQDQIKVG
ncbi:MAG: Nif3-like dinuclear metal center hexameric protein [Phycisphaerales bacterium]|nr:Nif3-like dinuclear metal center hexameric protein [Phycisphaerales bacterium]